MTKRGTDVVPMRTGRAARRWTRQGAFNLLLVCLMTGVVLAREPLLRPVLRPMAEAGNPYLVPAPSGALRVAGAASDGLLELRYPARGRSGTYRDARTGATATVSERAEFYRTVRPLAAPQGCPWNFHGNPDGYGRDGVIALADGRRPGPGCHYAVVEHVHIHTVWPGGPHGSLAEQDDFYYLGDLPGDVDRGNAKPGHTKAENARPVGARSGL